ncbi:hypothetical protein CDD83_8052 [Cordyceps sp. RAO-2017]|nr:hypothetical protein CDD83_8052 [Cordyceps sp. RAO-2017]
MAAPSIPNLLSMRDGGRGGGRGSRGGGDGPGGKRNARRSADAVIQDTDTDAAVSRLSAVDLGYLDDPYAKCFVSGPPTRRLPIINRGTYVRTRALDMMVAAFLAEPDQPGAEGKKQIISLGAGTDTRPFRLLESPRSQGLVYHEIDFEPTCDRKYQIARATAAVSGNWDHVEGPRGGSWTATWRQGGQYHCHAADLRDIRAGLAAAMGSAIRTDLPTLVLSECCLCYLSHHDAEAVLNFFQSRIAQLAVVMYEPMPLSDVFGRIMVSNLRARNISMPSAEHYKNEEGQEGRLREAGFETVGHATVGEAWDTWVGAEEKARLDALEGLDEVEEWKLLAAHYVVAWGTKRTGFGHFPKKATPDSPA